MRSLLHRWFVEYNPLYLVSASLVLGGMVQLSRGLALEGVLFGPLEVAAIAEAYAFALIGGAALLTRIGQRRPAVLLAFVTALYQSDPTLHTETCAYLGAGGVGALASTVWLALFLFKLGALAWALRLRVERGAWAASGLGALGLAVGPHVIRGLDARAGGLFVAALVFAVGAAAPPTTARAATSLVALDPWSRTVLRRSLRAVSMGWAGLLGVHVVFWSTQRPIDLAPALLALGALAAHRARSERRFWAVLAVGVVVATLVAPPLASVAALFAALACVRRAFALVPAPIGPAPAADAEVARPPSPYRAGDDASEPPRARVVGAAPPLEPLFVRAGARERARLAVGALFGLYLSAWTFGWRGGPFPDHALALDGALALATLVLAARTRAWLPVAPLAATSGHAFVVAGLVPVPRTSLGWGASAVSVGFVLLLASLAASYRLRDGARPPGTS